MTFALILGQPINRSTDYSSPTHQHTNTTMTAQQDVFGAVSSAEIFLNDEASTHEALKFAREAEKAAEERRKQEKEVEEVRTLRERMPILEAQKTALESRLATFEAEKTRLDNEISALKSSKIAIETEKTRIEDERSRLNGERSDLATQVLKLNSANAYLTTEFNHFKWLTTFEPRNNLDPSFHDRDVSICQASAPHIGVTFEPCMIGFCIYPA